MPTELEQITQLEGDYATRIEQMQFWLWLQRMLMWLLVSMPPVAWWFGVESVGLLVALFVFVLLLELGVWILYRSTKQDAHLLHLHLVCLQKPKYIPKDEGQ